ncbi:HEPN domain-containing protein [Candidatus Magnetomonas plexicatena]|uniref:HEPN domain-containing protein n=1 Tax=Candidatus Magnetomonas plexicatena TaxID=2552947 RepID=UPI0011022CA1|nr:HEPN domain-containing protein [Nitrospirales bacterium LBB_01]
MTEAAQKLLEKASRAISAALSLLERNDIDFAAGRTYYAMFYTTEALLNEKGVHFGKHGSLHSAFGEHFVKTGLMDKKFHRWLLDAYDKRILGDYGIESTLTHDDVKSMIERAEEFLLVARKYFELGSTSTVHNLI